MKSAVLKNLSITLLFLVVGFSVYANTFESPFIFDDTARIRENPHIRLTQFSLKDIVTAGFKSSKTRPVAYISFALNYYFHQYDPLGYHIVNISIHILAGFILYLFLKTTLTLPSIGFRYQHPEVIAFLAALIWLVHPVQTQSVTYIVQRMNSLAALFFILSFWCYVKGRLVEAGQKRWWWFAASALTWLVSLGCKEISVTLPFMVYLYEWYFFQNLNKDWFKRSLKYVLGLVALVVFIALVYMGFNPWEKISRLNDYAQNEFTILERSLTQFRVVVYYISLFFYPHPSRLNLDYDFALSHSLIDPVTTFVSLIAIVGLLGLAVFVAKKLPLISFGILWFFANLVIESSIIPLAIIFEHRLYLPTMLACLIPVVLAYRYVKPEKLCIPLLCALVIIGAYWTFSRNRVWQDEVTIWSDCVEKSPNKARPHLNLGAVLTKLEKTDEAIGHYLKALKIKPFHEKALNNMGDALTKQGKWDEAIDYIVKALQIKPNYADAYLNLGVALGLKGKTHEAIKAYHKALEIRPGHAKAHNGLGFELFNQNRPEEAIDHYQKALQLEPEFAEAHNNLCGALLKLSNPEAAINHCQEALRINPRIAEAHNNIGVSLMQKGSTDQAIKHFREALRIDPEFNAANNNLKRALAIQRNLEQEIVKIQKALAKDSENPVLHYQLGILFYNKGNLEKTIAQFKKVLSIQPTFDRVQNDLASVYAESGEYEKALGLFQKTLEQWPDNAGTYYNIACMYSRLNRLQASIDWLNKAVDKGYHNWNLIKTDSDLENLRKTQLYKEFIKGR
jgi:tetratricopeptide (TPR) repeat protein